MPCGFGKTHCTQQTWKSQAKHVNETGEMHSPQEELHWLGLALLGNAWLAFSGSRADLACRERADGHSLAGGKDSYHCQYEIKNFLIRLWNSYLVSISPLKAGYATSSNQAYSRGEEQGRRVFADTHMDGFTESFWYVFAEGAVERTMVGKLI